MIGRRLPDTRLSELPEGIQAGDYWKVVNGDGQPRRSSEPKNLTGTVWMIAAPMSYGYATGRLEKHTVREHDDGTITIAPNDGSSNSILVTGHRGEQYHGFIDRGVWT